MNNILAIDNIRKKLYLRQGFESQLNMSSKLKMVLTGNLDQNLMKEICYIKQF